MKNHYQIIYLAFPYTFGSVYICKQPSDRRGFSMSTCVNIGSTKKSTGRKRLQKTNRDKDIKWIRRTQVIPYCKLVSKLLLPGLETATVQLAHKILLLWKRNGNKFLVQYLKESYLILQKLYAGEDYLRAPNATGVAVSKDGWPSIIPKDLRLFDPKVYRGLLTIFSLYRVITYPGVLKLGSITDEFRGVSQILDINLINKVLIDRGLKGFSINPHCISARVWFKLKLNKFEPLLLTSSGPNDRISIHGTWQDAQAFLSEPWLLWEYFKVCFSVPKSMRYFVWLLFTAFFSLLEVKIDGLMLGRLSIKEEAAGKRRVFAITDWWTQCLLRPLHLAIFDILKTIPMDGTFNQSAPLKRLLDYPGNFRASFDLSSATDRLPIQLQIQILSCLGFKSAKAWGKLLVDREWFLAEKDVLLKYSVGQPMGALSSWAMLAMTHHVIVWVAAENAGKGGANFNGYALLGDDIVIADEEVAKHYKILMDILGVEISPFKSLVSHTGVMEFAKRLIGPLGEVSPIGPVNLVGSFTDWAYIPVILTDLLGKGWSPESKFGLSNFVFSFPHNRETLIKVQRNIAMVGGAFEPLWTYCDTVTRSQWLGLVNRGKDFSWFIDLSTGFLTDEISKFLDEFWTKEPRRERFTGITHYWVSPTYHVEYFHWNKQRWTLDRLRWAKVALPFLAYDWIHNETLLPEVLWKKLTKLWVSPFPTWQTIVPDVSRIRHASRRYAKLLRWSNQGYPIDHLQLQIYHPPTYPLDWYRFQFGYREIIVDLGTEIGIDYEIINKNPRCMWGLDDDFQPDYTKPSWV